MAGVVRPTGCHDLDLIEDQESARDRDDHGEHRHLANQRHGDPAKRLRTGGTVDIGRLVQLARDPLHRDDEQHHHVADRLPLAHRDDRPDRRRRFAQPGVLPGVEMERAEKAVDQPDLGVVHELEEEPRDRQREHGRDEVDGPKEVLPTAPDELLEDGRKDETAADLESHRDDRVRDVVEEGAPEDRVCCQVDVVVEPDPGLPRGERIPAEEAEAEVVDDREVDENGQEQNRWSDPQQHRPAAESRCHGHRSFPRRLHRGPRGGRDSCHPAGDTTARSWPWRPRPGCRSAPGPASWSHRALPGAR